MSQQLPIMDGPLVVALSETARAGILDEWRWLISASMQTVLVSACGDAFVKNMLDGTIHFLNVSNAELTPVAPTMEAFESVLAEPAFVQAFFYPERVDMLRMNGLILKKNTVYSFRTPLSLGGEIELKNIEIADVEVHFSIAGQIEEQIFNIPAGSPVGEIKIARMPQTKRWWKFWQ